MLKGDAKSVVALGNGGSSPIVEPDEWFAGSVAGRVNGTIPFIFSSSGIEAGRQLIYVAPALVLGRGKSNVEVFETEITGPASLRDIANALRADSRLTKRTYGLIEVEAPIEEEATASYAATATYSYTATYTSSKCPQHPETIEVSGEPLTVLLSANPQDTHGIRANGENVHLNNIQLPEGAVTRGIILTLS